MDGKKELIEMDITKPISCDEYLQKDAIHIAIVVVKAGMDLQPGEKIYLLNEVALTDRPRKFGRQLIGLVNPYLDRFVKKEELFHLFMFPNSVVQIRHEWSHPQIPIADPDILGENNIISKMYLENKGRCYGITLNEILTTHPNEWCGSSDDTNDDFHNDHEFWQHYTKVTGNIIDLTNLYIRCAC